VEEGRHPDAGLGGRRLSVVARERPLDGRSRAVEHAAPLLPAFAEFNRTGLGSGGKADCG
jgi:hypothetical protein